MTSPRQTDLVGILVGAIIRDAPPLIFYLYQTGDVSRHTRVTECQKCTDPATTVRTLVQTYKAAVAAVWTNRYFPVWWYVQLTDDALPDRLRLFGLPWSVYYDWETKLALE
jgi:hypothetical protein